MALPGIPILSLPAVAAAQLTDVLPVVQDGVTSKETLQQISDLFGSINYPVTLAHGGTGAALTASNGGIFYSNATTGAILSGTATAHQVLLSGTSAAPAWSTATYPPTTTVSQLLYSSSSNVIAGLATANDGVLVTGNTGIPSVLVGPGVTGDYLKSNAAAAPAWASFTAPTITQNSAPGTYTYTVPAGVKYIYVEIVGGGAGGGGSSDSTHTDGGTGGDGGFSIFGDISGAYLKGFGGSGGGGSGSTLAGGAGGTSAGVTFGSGFGAAGGGGAAGVKDGSAAGCSGGIGGGSYHGGGARGNTPGNNVGVDCATTGSGGSGASAAAGGYSGGGGGAGGFATSFVYSPLSATYPYTVGASGAKGAAGTGGAAGGLGLSGAIYIFEYYQ